MFAKEGADAAHDLGMKLGLAPSTLKNWLRGMAKELKEETGDVTKGRKILASVPLQRQRVINTEGNTIGKKRFHLSYWPEMKGVIQEPGPEASRVRFDTTILGNHDAFPNEYLIIEEEPKPKKRK